MTLAELHLKFLKADILLGTGIIIGEAIAHFKGLNHSWLFGLLTGLLFSLRIYHDCIIVLADEYRRLRAKGKR